MQSKSILFILLLSISKLGLAVPGGSLGFLLHLIDVKAAESSAYVLEKGYEHGAYVLEKGYEHGTYALEKGSEYRDWASGKAGEYQVLASEKVSHSVHVLCEEGPKLASSVGERISKVYTFLNNNPALLLGFWVHLIDVKAAESSAYVLEKGCEHGAYVLEKGYEHGTYALEKGYEHGTYALEKGSEYRDWASGKAGEYQVLASEKVSHSVHVLCEEGPKLASSVGERISKVYTFLNNNPALLILVGGFMLKQYIDYRFAELAQTTMSGSKYSSPQGMESPEELFEELINSMGQSQYPPLPEGGYQ